MVGKSARFLAPIALVAVALGIYVIVHSTLRHHSSPVVTRTGSEIVNTRRQPHRTHHQAKFYVVKPGDTLSGIAVRTGVPLGRLMTLNPSLSGSPNNLQTGERLRLRH